MFRHESKLLAVQFIMQVQVNVLLHIVYVQQKISNCHRKIVLYSLGTH